MLNSRLSLNVRKNSFHQLFLIIGQRNRVYKNSLQLTICNIQIHILIISGQCYQAILKPHLLFITTERPNQKHTHTTCYLIKQSVRVCIELYLVPSQCLYECCWYDTIRIQLKDFPIFNIHFFPSLKIN